MTAYQIISTVIGVLGLFISAGIIKVIIDYRKKWTNLHNLAKKQKYMVKCNEDFFEGWLDCRIKSFNNKMPLVEKNDDGKKSLSIKHLPQNYLIVGKAGDGKSTLVQKDYINSYKVRKKKCTLFFNIHNFEEVIKSGIDSYLKDIFKDLKIKEICLFIDGIDEFGEKNIDLLNEFISAINKYCTILSIKASSRSDFANKYNIKSILKNKGLYVSNLELEDWDKAVLLEIADDVINQRGRKKKVVGKETQELKQKVSLDVNNSFGMIIKNPLLLRLYLFIIINDYQFDLSKIERDGVIKEYDLFNYFIDIFLMKMRKKDNYLDDKIDIAKRAFNAYCKQTKLIASKRPNEVPLFKPITEGNVTFVHERFYEFFVAFYYKEMLVNLTINNITNEIITILSKEYSKAYAAFITDAIRLEKENMRDAISNKLIHLYRYTLLPEQDEQYIKKIGESEALDETIKQEINNITGQDFLLLKDEIVFRLARLQTTAKQTEKILKALQFIYENDNNINKVSDEWKEYWIAIYKRSCAISSSLLGGVSIECDYVRHMLNFSPYDKQYKPEYDLANRSHTLIYYGDERNYELLQFKDQAGHNWNNAREARLKRLRKDPSRILIPNITLNSDEDKKLLKAFRFRLFDLATLYCFLSTRTSEIKEYSEVLTVVKNSIVDFNVKTKIEQKRCNIMKDIQNAIIDLFNSNT